MDIPVTLEDIRRAAVNLGGKAHRTSVMTCGSLDRMTGGQLYFKCENLQKAGAFKFRGALNAVMSLPKDAAVNGVATHSSGNHGAALALAGRICGIPVHIVMPETAPAVKQAAVEGYGGRITFCQPTLEARESTLKVVMAETGAMEIHPYNNWTIIAGAATVALELLEEVKDLDMVLAPIGGGGLMSGTALVTRFLSPAARVIGTEPAAADDAYRSFQAGEIIPSRNPTTICDGLRTSLGERTFAVISKYVDEIVTVSEEAIAHAMRTFWERAKLIIEPSSAVPLAALLDGRIDVQGKKAGIILSGGNVDLGKLPWNL